MPMEDPDWLVWARELREEIGLSEALIRVSIGIENVEDLISDLAQGLEYV